MSEIHKYRLQCTTEAATKYVWSKDTPTVCPDDGGHTIDTGSITIVETISENVTQVTETSDGSYFNYETLEFSIPAGATGAITTHSHSWPMAVQIWLPTFYVGPDNVGDKFDIVAAPDTTIGGIGVTGTIGDTTLVVSPTVLQYIQAGFYVTLTDIYASPPTVQELNRCVGIDKTNSTITVETALTANANPGSLISIDAYMVKNAVLDHVTDIEMAKKGIRGKILDANTPVTLYYTNNSAAAKKFNLHVQYYFGNVISGFE